MSKKIEHGFVPTEIIFSCTTICNLHCPHCFINRNPQNLDAQTAIDFLESTRNSSNSQIEKIGFSGGEPFLRLDFLEKVIKAAIEKDFMFDRIMTNGDWWKDENDLKISLQRIYDAGYDGKIGLSYDNFHGQSEERICTFIKNSWEFFGGNSIELQCVTNDEKKFTEKLQSLANALGLEYKHENGAAFFSDEEKFIFASIQKESFHSEDERAWKDEKWFKDDYCEGPGQILFVHATGEIAPCCGFANENNALFIGKITDSFDTILENSQKNPFVKKCYEEGLLKEVARLKKENAVLPGKTNDICTFCDFLCKSQR